MCDCKQDNKGNAHSIALAFNQNKLPVAAVFTKWGLGNVPVNGETIIAGTVYHGADFAKEISLAMAGVNPNISNAGGDDADLAASIFSMIASAADTGINIAKGVSDIKNSNKGTTTPTTPTGNGQVVYLPQPTAPKTEQRYFGFTGGQLALLGLGIVLVGAVVWFVSGDNK